MSRMTVTRQDQQSAPELIPASIIANKDIDPVPLRHAFKAAV